MLVASTVNPILHSCPEEYTFEYICRISLLCGRIAKVFTRQCVVLCVYELPPHLSRTSVYTFRHLGHADTHIGNPRKTWTTVAIHISWLTTLRPPLGSRMIHSLNTRSARTRQVHISHGHATITFEYMRAKRISFLVYTYFTTCICTHLFIVRLVFVRQVYPSRFHERETIHQTYPRESKHTFLMHHDDSAL